MTTTTSTTASTTQSAISSTLASAAQSIISGSTKSSLDVSTLVSSLVTAKTTAQATAIANKTASDNTMLSAVSQIKSALSSLQTSLSGLSDGTALAAYTATSDGKGLTATAGTTAVPGSYSVQVVNIASAQKITSAAHQATDTYGSGTLSLSLGSTSMSLSLTGNETLSDIASSINSASANPGISATIVTGQDGQHLVLASKSTGASNSISVTTSGSVDSSLGYSSTNASNYTESSKAADADLYIDGTEVTSPSNTLTSAISGMTLNLTSASAGTTQNLTVASDTTAETTSITNFVNAYNSFVSQAAALSSFDSTQAAGSQGGVLLGDSMLQSIRSTLSTIITSGISTNGSSSTNLASIGVNLQSDGTLAIDSTTLANSLSNSSTKVNQLFNQVNGIGSQLGDKIDNFLASGGIIDSRTTALNADLKSLTTQTTALQTYADSLTSQYNTQFTALNTLMATMANNTSYLTQLFGGSNSAGALATNK
jgi:flagellar hook-associated protein 2